MLRKQIEKYELSLTQKILAAAQNWMERLDGSKYFKITVRTVKQQWAAFYSLKAVIYNFVWRICPQLLIGYMGRTLLDFVHWLYRVYSEHDMVYIIQAFNS